MFYIIKSKHFFKYMPQLNIIDISITLNLSIIAQGSSV